LFIAAVVFTINICCYTIAPFFICSLDGQNGETEMIAGKFATND
jgi:hypothetical protein